MEAYANYFGGLSRVTKHRSLNLKRLIYAVPWDLFERYFERLEPIARPDAWAWLNPTVLQQFLDDEDNGEASAAIMEDFQRINDLGGQYVGVLYRALDRAGLTYDQESPAP